MPSFDPPPPPGTGPGYVDPDPPCNCGARTGQSCRQPGREDCRNMLERKAYEQRQARERRMTVYGEP